MKNFLLVVGISLLLSGCSILSSEEEVQEHSSETPPEQVEVLPPEKQIQGATFVLKETEKDAQHVTFVLTLLNPHKHEISSLRSFLAFQPRHLQGTSLHIHDDQPFTFAAPGERQFDNEQGIVRLGFSVQGQASFSEAELEIATLTFSRKEQIMSIIDWYSPTKFVQIFSPDGEAFANIADPPDEAAAVITP